MRKSYIIVIIRLVVSYKKVLLNMETVLKIITVLYINTKSIEKPLGFISDVMVIGIIVIADIFFG